MNSFGYINYIILKFIINKYFLEIKYILGDDK